MITLLRPRTFRKCQAAQALVIARRFAMQFIQCWIYARSVLDKILRTGSHGSRTVNAFLVLKRESGFDLKFLRIL